MRLRVVGPSFLLLLLFAPLVSVARGEDVIWIIRHVEDLPLAQAVRETAELGDIRVEVESSLRARRITVDLNEPIVGAIQVLARAANAHLWKLGDKRYAVRTEPPPPSRAPTREELEGPEPEGDPEPEPPWAAKIRQALEVTPFEGRFRKTPLSEFLAALGKQAKVPVHLDPRVLRTRKRRDLLVDFEDALGDSSVDQALTLFCAVHGLGALVRWGAVFVTSREDLCDLPGDVFLPGVDPELRKRLASSRVSTVLKKAKLEGALLGLLEHGTAKVVVSKAARAHAKKIRFRATFRDRRLDHALAVLLVPEGLALDVVDEKLTVVVRPPPRATSR